MKCMGVAGLLLLGVTFGCSGTVPDNLGVRDGRLSACPDSPNCVSSQAQPEDEKHFIEPLTYTGPKADAMKRLFGVLNTQERVKIVQKSGDYFHVEFKTALMRFVDDVEFYFPDEPVIHVRSASRLGTSDLGVNRKRVELLRSLFNGKP